MTSLTLDLQKIDLGPVNGARDLIRKAVSDADVQRLLGGDAFETALGGLGSALGDLRRMQTSASGGAGALLQPIVDAAQGLVGHIDIGALPMTEYTKAIRDGIGIILRLVQAVQDPSSLGQLLPADRILQAAGSLTQGFSTAGGDLARVGALVERLERGVGADARALATFAADALLPFSGESLLDLRGRVDAVIRGSVSISLPSGRTAGLLLALDGVANAAANPPQLARALADLQRVRTSTIGVLRDDLRQIRDAFQQLHIVQTLDAIIEAARVIRAGESGFLEMLETWRSQIAAVREQIDAFDAAAIHQMAGTVLDMLEEQARLLIEKPIDEAVVRAEEFVRGLFRELPHRRIRAEISAFLAGVARAIRDLELDRVAREANALLERIEKAVDPNALGAEVQAVLADVRALADRVLGGVAGALNVVASTIQSVEAQLQGVLQRVVSVLNTFSTTIQGITTAIETLGVEEAADQVVATIRELRATAEKLLGNVPLPEPLRPAVEQVLSTLESIDLDVVFRPVEAAADQLKVPNEVKTQMTAALRQAAEKLENAIPAALIESIQSEVDTVLKTIRGFDPATLLRGVTKYIEEAARLIESLDPVAAAQQIRGPFQAVLDAIDSAHPRRLLAPAIEGYETLVGNVRPPDISSVLQRLTGAINAAGASLTGQLVAPIGQFTGGTPQISASGGAGATAPAAGQGPPSSGHPAAPASAGLPGGFRPGDVVRFLGWIPAKLRDALHALPATSVGEALRTIDSITTGLARDLRLIRSRILEFDARIVSQLEGELRLVADAQVRAQLAIHARAPGVDVNVSLDALATVSASEMLRELSAFVEELRTVTRAAAGGASGSAASVLDRAATALESFRLSAIAGDADGFLAALDPEPIAAEIDALVASLVARAPRLLTEAETDIRAAIERVQRLLDELNPAAQARKFFRLVDLLRDELNVLNPSVLADELGGIHAAIRDSVSAYDPAVLARNVRDVLTNLAASLRALNPATLLGDLDLFGPIIAKIEQANPAEALQNVGASLAGVGEQLRALDPGKLLDDIEQLAPRVVAAFELAIKSIKDELVALLESIRYATANASVSVSASASL